MTKQVVYLTGAPAAGKTTLANNILNSRSDVMLFEYGRAMADHLAAISATKSPVALSDLRGGTEGRVSRADIETVDGSLIEWIAKNKASNHLIVEGHNLTIEKYGFRAVFFDKVKLLKMQFTEIWLAVCDSDATLARMSNDPQGRLRPTPFGAALHTNMQAATAIEYAVASSCPLYTFDTSTNDPTLWKYADLRLDRS